jgi:CheY-like chemotaxis protein
MVQSAFEMARDPVPLRILVVEDEYLIRASIADALRELGVSVVEASTADEAWRYLESGASIDLVFTDHRMPGSRTGAQLARQIRERYPGVIVVITSAVFDDRGWTERVLPKPYDLYDTAAELVAQASRAKAQGAGDA